MEASGLYQEKAKAELMLAAYATQKEMATVRMEPPQELMMKAWKPVRMLGVGPRPVRCSALYRCSYGTP